MTAEIKRLFRSVYESVVLMRELGAHHETPTITAQLDRVREAERSRLAQVIHDRAGQDLSVALLQLAAIERSAPPELARAIASVGDLIEGTALTLRDLAVDLSPPLLHTEGLCASLRALGQRFEERWGLRCLVDVEEQAEPAARGTRAILYRAAAELLTNSARHGRPSAIRLVLRRRPSMIELTVADDGRGFVDEASKPLERESWGFGLRSIEEELHRFGGELKIESSALGGTKTTIEIPVIENGAFTPKPEASR